MISTNETRQSLVARDITTADTLKARALAAIRSARDMGEGELLQAIFPRPAYPKGADLHSEETAEWRKQVSDYNDRAYCRTGVVEYRDCYSALLAQATIALADAGLIRTTNNGYNCYTYHAR